MNKTRADAIDYAALPLKKESSLRIPLSIWFLVIQVVVWMLAVSHRGEPKRLWHDS
jgi:hypothetical protein